VDAGIRFPHIQIWISNHPGCFVDGIKVRARRRWGVRMLSVVLGFPSGHISGGINWGIAEEAWMPRSNLVPFRRHRGAGQVGTRQFGRPSALDILKRISEKRLDSPSSGRPVELDATFGALPFC